MENNKGQTIFLSVVGVATLLVAIVGATFAYFSINVVGNETASSIQVTTAKVGGVTFVDGTGIQFENVYPGYSDSKSFTVSSAADAGADAVIPYEIHLVNVVNTISTSTGGTEWLKHTLTGTQNDGGTGTLATVAETNATATAADTILASGILRGAGNTHSYDYTLTFVESTGVQNEAQGKAFSGLIQIVINDAQGRRTWDNAQSSWVQYSGV